MLIKDDGATNEDGKSTEYYSTIENSDRGALLEKQTLSLAQGIVGQSYPYGRSANFTPRNDDLRSRENNGYTYNSQINDEFSFMPDGPTDGFCDGGSGNHDSQAKFSRQQFDKYARRTVLLANFPDGTTHADIVNAVRGGLLLDIFLRTHDRTASISFLEGSHAEDFFRHVKRHDLYIRGKRVGPPIFPMASSDLLIVHFRTG